MSDPVSSAKTSQELRELFASSKDAYFSDIFPAIFKKTDLITDSETADIVAAKSYQASRVDSSAMKLVTVRGYEFFVKTLLPHVSISHKGLGSVAGCLRNVYNVLRTDSDCDYSLIDDNAEHFAKAVPLFASEETTKAIFDKIAECDLKNPSQALAAASLFHAVGSLAACHTPLNARLLPYLEKSLDTLIIPLLSDLRAKAQAASEGVYTEEDRDTSSDRTREALCYGIAKSFRESQDAKVLYGTNETFMELFTALSDSYTIRPLAGIMKVLEAEKKCRVASTPSELAESLKLAFRDESNINLVFLVDLLCEKQQVLLAACANDTTTEGNKLLLKYLGEFLYYARNMAERAKFSMFVGGGDDNTQKIANLFIQALFPVAASPVAAQTRVGYSSSLRHFVFSFLSAMLSSKEASNAASTSKIVEQLCTTEGINSIFVTFFPLLGSSSEPWAHLLHMLRIMLFKMRKTPAVMRNFTGNRDFMQGLVKFGEPQVTFSVDCRDAEATINRSYESITNILETEALRSELRTALI